MIDSLETQLRETESYVIPQKRHLKSVVNEYKILLIKLFFATAIQGFYTSETNYKKQSSKGNKTPKELKILSFIGGTIKRSDHVHLTKLIFRVSRGLN